MNKEYLSQYFSYDPETGSLSWVVARGNRVKAGTQITRLHNTGYVVVVLHGKFLLVHRIAMILSGLDLKSSDCVDHINNIKCDNRLKNLRIATYSQNAQNSKRRKHNKSGLKGVRFNANNKNYGSRIYVNRKEYWLGSFATAQEAHMAYQEASKKLHGEFGRIE